MLLEINQQVDKVKELDNSKKQDKPTILITGANGFVGSHLVEEANQRGYQVYAGIRNGSGMNSLKGQEFEVFPFELNRPDEVRKHLIEYADHGVEFDHVIHCAAVTKPKKIDEFYSGNSEFTHFFARAIKETHPNFKKFIYISSMAAMGPGDPVSYTPITENDHPRPFTPYGKSKLKAEEYLMSIDGLEYMIFRPMAVYGPRDKKFMLRLIDVLKKGFEVSIGSAKVRSAVVYVKDLTKLMFDGLESEITKEIFNVSDGKYYPQKEIGRTLRKELGIKAMSIRIPRWLMMGIGYGLLYGNRIVQKPLHLSPYKIRELTALNWTVDISKAEKMLDFEPEHYLHSGIKETVRWYLSETQQEAE